MALRLFPSFQFPPFSSSLNYPNSKATIRFSPRSTLRFISRSISTRRNRSIILKSTQESTNTDATEAETQSPANETPRDGDEKSGRPDGKLADDEASQLGAEIKKAMQERADKEPSFLSGVGQEIGEIEWPAFGKVLGTTGVVLGVIAGSSVVLLTVNAVLAELSDRVFAGKGVQDFFG